MAHKHISPMGKLAGHKTSAEGSVDRFCRNIFFLCGGRRVLSCRTDNEFWLLYRSYGAIEGRYPAERAEKWRKDSNLHADIPPRHMFPSPQLFLIENFPALLFWVNYFAEQMLMVENLAWRILQSRSFFGGESSNAALFGGESCRADFFGREAFSAALFGELSCREEVFDRESCRADVFG
jgi:hypothetical protein